MALRRNQQIQDFDISSSAPGSTRATCAQLGPRSFQVVVAGDDARNVRLWKISKRDSLLNFQGHSSEITSVVFSTSEDEVYSGSFGGTVIIWDINSQRPISSLKGHMSACLAIAPFPVEQRSYLATGSVDCNLKLWDLRRKTCVQTFKGHKGPVNAVGFSPDSKWVASGSADGTIKIWDLSMGRKLTEFAMGDSPVTCLRFNPQNMSMASGHADRTVKYWDLETLGHISTTAPDSTPIQRICFEPHDGKLLFAAANDSLKLWNIEHSVLCDSIESSWKGVVDLEVNTKDDVVVGLCINGNSLSLWSTDLRSVSVEASSQEEQRPNPVERPKRKEKVDLGSSFVPTSGNQPIGLDINEFLPKQKGVDEQQLCTEISQEHDSIITLMRRRQENVNGVLNWWTKGDVSATLSALNMMGDISTTADVLREVVLGSNAQGFPLEKTPPVLGLAKSLIESKYEPHIKVGVQVTLSLLGNYRNIITATLTAPPSAGVDLSREERARKCQVALEAFQSVKESNSLAKNAKRENKTGEVCKKLVKDLDTFIWECNRG